MILSKRMDRRILLQSKVQERNSNGALKDVWTDYKETWASIDWNNATTQWDGTRQSTLYFLTFETRWDEAINSKMRIVLGEEIFEIRNVIEMGRRGGLRITTLKFDS